MAFQTVGSVPQVNLLLSHFHQRNSISGVEAAALFRIRALPRRIKDLEALGHRFRRERRKDSTGQVYVRYHYLGRFDGAVL